MSFSISLLRLANPVYSAIHFMQTHYPAAFCMLICKKHVLVLEFTWIVIIHLGA